MPASSGKPTIAITLGDPAGIGPEVIEKTLRDPRLPKGFNFAVLGRTPENSFSPGRSTQASARIALRALKEAAQGCLEGRFAAVVTGPVQKETIARLEPDFVGQTEFFARACRRPDADAVMVLTDPKLTVGLCSQHCALKDALKRLTSARILYVAQQVSKFLQQRGVAKPRLAIAGVNPHAGEHGLFGHEEERVLRPAIDLLRSQGQDATGPHSPDTVFYHALQGSYDAVICAYHDQGLIPFKLVAFKSGVNITLGLPVIRTSPDHGTALSIAGRGVADHRSMLAATRLACRLVRVAGKELVLPAGSGQIEP